MKTDEILRIKADAVAAASRPDLVKIMDGMTSREKKQFLDDMLILCDLLLRRRGLKPLLYATPQGFFGGN